MASMSHSTLPFSGAASDLLRSSSNGVTGVPLKTLGKARLGAIRRQNASIVAKVRKVKKQEYPWPDDPDPNVKGGVLSHLSHFKPLKEKPKPVTLDFERPLVELEKKIVDVRKMAGETGLDFTNQILSLEKKYQQALKDLYTHLTPIQRVNIARHPNRPTFLDHVISITDKWIELHGDRAGYDDPAIVTGLGTMDGRRYMFMGHQKGRNTKENIQRNFGMPTPHGYRKALRMMYYADHHGFPIVTFIDTPGAYADLKSEELGQGEAIAHNLRTMFGLKVPIISIVIGEGGSGGALAIGCANKLLMLENAVFYVASPEACAAILWKSAKASPKAAEKLKITAGELCKLDICDGIIPEPLGGAHADPTWTSQQIRNAINVAMDELTQMDTQELLKHRSQKFRKIGGFQEGIPIDPERKVNMKKKEIDSLELQAEVDKLKQEVLEASKHSKKPPEADVNEMVEKLQREVNHEFSEAVNSLGLKDKLLKLQEELSKAKDAGQLLDSTFKDRLEEFKDEFLQNMSDAPNIASLNQKSGMLKELVKTKCVVEKTDRASTLKLEISNRLKEVLDRPDVKEKIENVKAAIQNSGASQAEELDEGLKEEIVKVKKEIDFELANVLKPLDLDIVHVKSKKQISASEVNANIKELQNEIEKSIDDVVNSSELKDKIELLRSEARWAAQFADTESKKKVEALEQQIRQTLAEAMNSPDLVEKYENLRAEISVSKDNSGGLDGTLIKEESRAELGAENSVA